jgi:hypothetical protein
MTLEEIIKKFGSGHNACLVLRISYINFSNWKKKGCIPEFQQLRIEKMTEGMLKADNFSPDRKSIKNKDRA